MLDATYAPEESLRDALLRLRREASEVDGVIALSDRRTGPERLPVPMALAVGAVHEHLLATGERMAKDIVAIAGDAVDVHDLACLITVGATAVHPYLALATASRSPEGAGRAQGARDAMKYRKALEAGLLKVMAKMGISTAMSYRGGEVIEALGLGAEVMELCFPAVPSRIGGADLADLERLARTRPEALPDHGRVRFRKAGEHHAYNPLAVRAAQKAAQTGDQDAYREWRRLSSMDQPQSLRELIHIKESATPVPLEEVEPASEIVKRFVSTAMSLGALSPEAHEALAIAMNQVGARSNSGEGGEDPDTYKDDGGGVRRKDNRVKQVASARFGVTPRYLKRADELEIKIAQGSKPGEGGQLPGMKVTNLIARLRHAQPGQQLISPPPHHDIYSIEDLAQLIHDLKTVNPRARIGVKLVSEAGVGTIAAGVAKAKADYILVSGHDGGTGASPLVVDQERGRALGARPGRDAAGAGRQPAARARQPAHRRRAAQRPRHHHRRAARRGRVRVRHRRAGRARLRHGAAVSPQHLPHRHRDAARRPAREVHRAPGARDQLPVPDRRRGARAPVPARSTLAAGGGRPSRVARARTTRRRSTFLHVLAPTDQMLPRLRVSARNGDVPAPPPPSGDIDNSHRTVGAALLPNESRQYRGSAGQSFGAFLDEGVELSLEGQAQDYVGKGMGGGVIAIRPFAGDGATDPVLAGNTICYGATGGRLFVAGRVGERFCVRNSGATAVVEGAGDHFCEYMTGGVAVALGPIGWNAGAGMTGGVAYVTEWNQLNADSVVAREVPAEDALSCERWSRSTTGAPAANWRPACSRTGTRSLKQFRQLVPAGVRPDARITGPRRTTWKQPRKPSPRPSMGPCGAWPWLRFSRLHVA